MAKLQRWRRRSTAGEGAAPAAAVDTVEPLDGTEPAVDEADEVAWDEVDDVEEAEELVEDGYDDAPAAVATPATAPPLSPVERSGPGSWTAVLLAQAAHLKQAVFTALCVGGVAALVGRPAREAGVILVTVLVGQTILGWHNDIVDADKDRAHGAKGKPIADGRLGTGTAWYAIVVAALVLVPLAITTGITAACFYLGSVAIAMVGNVLGRTGFFSWWSWAVAFGLLPAYLSYGGWGGQAVGEPPEVAITVLAGVLGIGVHFMRSVWGLVADHEAGWTYLPLKLGLRLGATRLLALSTLFTIGVAVALGVVGVRVGLSE